jgi:hypothetical protein
MSKFMALDAWLYLTQSVVLFACVAMDLTHHGGSRWAFALFLAVIPLVVTNLLRLRTKGKSGLREKWNSEGLL